jgi:hypothetical protein
LQKRQTATTNFENKNDNIEDGKLSTAATLK